MAEPRYRILMVDDVTRYHKLFELAITDALPAQVHFAVNGEEALVKLATPQPYDLMILDLNMPKLNGEETLKRIRQDPNFDTMPVIILTGDTDQETHRRLLDIGADDFVEKGASPDIFVARLKAQLRHKLTLERLTRLAIDMDIFAAGVLHDIRSLETTILSVCELARDYLETDPTANRDQICADLNALAEKTELLGRYASEIIRMVRETHKPLAPEPQELKPLIEWVVKVITKRAAQGEGAFECRIEGELAPLVADRHFLQLAFLNIIQNAVKYRRPAVAPKIVISQRPGRSGTVNVQDTTVITRIEDNGIGLKQHELRRIFEPFVRGARGTQKAGGFGLGLSLVQKVITAMGGRVWAEINAEGPGTTMCIELPVATQKAVDEPAAAAKGAARHG